MKETLRNTGLIRYGTSNLPLLFWKRSWTDGTCIIFKSGTRFCPQTFNMLITRMLWRPRRFSRALFNKISKISFRERLFHLETAELILQSNLKLLQCEIFLLKFIISTQSWHVSHNGLQWKCKYIFFIVNNRCVTIIVGLVFRKKCTILIAFLAWDGC